jgi:hypothetical protein
MTLNNNSTPTTTAHNMVRPQADYVKCNIDTAIFVPENKSSMRACVCNDEG